jgi:arsenate reductase
MLVLGLQGSPRRNGNTHFLLSAFMKALDGPGVEVRVVEIDEMHIVPCKEYLVCEREGFCPIDDDMKNEIYPLLREAEIIVVATPIFFYGTTAQIKALIDRSQALWARRYRLKLNDPGQKWRRGFLLALGATRGENLFRGVSLTARYFFDAVGAGYEGSLTYRCIEKPGDMEKHPTVFEDVKKAAGSLLRPFLGRKKILFACRENACRSQMASAFIQQLAGDKIEVLHGGKNPASRVNPIMIEVMKEKGIDMAFRRPKSIEDALKGGLPDRIITLGCDDVCPFSPGVEFMDWAIPDPAGQPINVMRRVRDEIKKKVIQLIEEGWNG